MSAYPLAQDRLRPVLRVAMSRAMRVVAPGGTMPVVARCNNREFSFATAEGSECLRAHLREMRRTYAVTLYAYTRMANHAHLLLQAPMAEVLGRRLRWLRTETAKAFHKARGRRVHFLKIRQRQYRTLLTPSPEPAADARDSRWSTQRAVGSAAFVVRYTPRRGRRRIVPMPPQIQALGA